MFVEISYCASKNMLDKNLVKLLRLWPFYCVYVENKNFPNSYHVITTKRKKGKKLRMNYYKTSSVLMRKKHFWDGTKVGSNPL